MPECISRGYLVRDSKTRTTITLLKSELAEIKKKAENTFGGNVSLFLRTLAKRYQEPIREKEIRLVKGK